MQKLLYALGGLFSIYGEPILNPNKIFSIGSLVYKYNITPAG